MLHVRTVAFQGEKGAFSEQAALAFFQTHVTLVPQRNFKDVFDSVAHGKVDTAIVPIENSLFGSVHQNYDLLEQYHLNIVGEVKLRVVHNLMVNRGVTMRDVKYIYSHPQALGQCDEFLNALRGVEIVSAYDTAGAAKMLKEQTMLNAAAIASAQAAKDYGLKILKRNIENNHHNFTRFLILSRRSIVATKNAKTSIIFALKNIPGVLFKALSVFALRDLDLHKIESRPIVGKPWEYVFYLDFEGSMKHAMCKNAINHLSEIATYLRILGSYEKGKTVG
jgi:prephenate dehydratase